MTNQDDGQSADKLTEQATPQNILPNVASIDVRSKRYASWVSALKGDTKSGAVVTPASNGFTHHYRNGERAKHVKDKRSLSGSSSHHHHTQSHPHTAHKPTHTSTHKHHSIKGEGIVKKDKDRCVRCEAMLGEEVCGRNGKTYNSLCHAVNCAGLSQDDISAGPCTQDVSSFTLCVCLLYCKYY